MDWLDSLLKPTIEIKKLRTPKAELIILIKADKTVILRRQHGEFHKTRCRESLLEAAEVVESLIIYPDGSIKHNKK